MQKTIITLLIFSVCRIYALEGQILTNQVFKSDKLKQSVLYNVYLPPLYSQDREYPVLFYLHWFGGNHHSANDIMQKIDALIGQEKFPELLIIAPDAKLTWYIDDYKGENNYSSMFINEFLPYVEEKYPISEDSRKRAVTGSSMGGFGALRFSMLYPDQFGICISFMAGISTKDQIVMDNDADYKLYHQNLYGNDLRSGERVNAFFINNNPLYIAQSTAPEKLKKTKWYIQTCDDDYHSLPNAELHAVFHRLGVKHEFRVNDGQHDGNCINQSLDDALNFLKENIE